MHISSSSPSPKSFFFSQVKYNADDSTTFWAVGRPDSGIIARHAEFCGKEVEMTVPFEGVSSAEVCFP